MPARKSNRYKELSGSRAKVKRFPQAPPKTVDEPDFLALLNDEYAAGEASAWFRSVMPVLDNLGLVSRLDGATIIDCAICHGRIRQCERELGSNLLVDGPRGTKVRNPVSMTLASLRQAMSGYAKALGLSPQSRQSMDIPNQRGKDDLNPLERIWINNACRKMGIDQPDFEDESGWDLNLPQEVFELAKVKWPR
jgi:P27 family predicted phage terminase small subunit